MAVKYEVVKITISFSANPEEQTLDINELGEGNFEWVAYGILFKIDREDKYYAYGVKLDPDGDVQDGTAYLYSSDSAGKLHKDEEIGIIPDDVHRFFPRLFFEKKPALVPHGDYPVIYINTHEEDKGKIYSSNEFRRQFDKDYYVVITKEKIMKNPFGKMVGRRGEKKASESFYDSINIQATDEFGSCPECGSRSSKIVWGWHGSYYDMVCSNGHQWTYNFEVQNRAVRNAMMKLGYFSGGFDIMKKFQKKLRKEQKSKKKPTTAV